MKLGSSVSGSSAYDRRQGRLPRRNRRRYRRLCEAQQSYAEQANRLYDRINNGVETISGGNRAIQRELDEATRRYVTTPDSPESRRALEESYRRHADTPEKRRAAEDVTRALIAPTQQRDADAVVRLNLSQI